MTYEIKTVGEIQTITYTGGDVDGLVEQYYGEPPRNGYTDINAPNYYGLEQDLFDLLLTSMQAYAQTYNDKGLLFTQTLSNGKRGEVVNQARLIMGLNLMGISFTQSDKDSINTVFANNNFSVRLQ